jgi:dephospho-CoA kinase
MKKYFMFGKSGTGKDTVTEILLEKHHIQSLALADPIREEYKRFFGRDDYKQNRPKMIEIGESYKQIYGEEVWCRLALQRINEAKTIKAFDQIVKHKGMIIRDGRYEHEYDFFVVKHGFIPIRLVADDTVRYQRLNRRDGNTQLDALKYENEKFISDKRDAITIDNSSTIEELIAKLSEVFK